MTSEIHVGAEIPPYELQVDPRLIGTMAALMGDPVPIHLDPAVVRRLGIGDRIVNQGPMAFGYLVELLGRWVGDVERVRSVRCRFVTHVFAGDQLRCTGTVTEVEGGLARVALGIHRDGQLVVRGEGVVVVDGEGPEEQPIAR